MVSKKRGELSQCRGRHSGPVHDGEEGEEETDLPRGGPPPGGRHQRAQRDVRHECPRMRTSATDV